MSKFFIHRPIFAIVLSLLIVLLGGLAMVILPVSMFPPISPPVIQVQTSYFGASAAVVEKAVANVIENQVVGVDHMIYMQSTSTSNGQYVLNCTFAVGASVEQALIDVQNRVSQAAGTLPQAVTTYGVTVQKKSPQILQIIAVYAPHRSYDALFLSNYATINVLNPLLSVPGVGGSAIMGQFNYAMRAWMRPDKLANLGLEASDVQTAIKNANVLIPTGSVGALPAPKGTQFQVGVTAEGQLLNPKQFGDIIVKANPDGSVLHLSDVARLELGSQTYQTIGELNGSPATLIILYQTPDANAISTAKNVRATMEQLKSRFPPGLDYAIPYDSTVFVESSIHDVEKTLFEAIALVVLVVFVFLGGVRAAFIPMLAVPVSLVGTFAVFVALGFSINTLTLFGMVLAIGIVVDDAIVVVEAVEKFLEEGLGPLEATERAMRDLQGPVIGIALVLVAVFLPSAFITGITGELYKQFALTLSVSVSISAFVALTLTPALCVLILRPRTGRLWGPFGWFTDRFNAVFARTTAGYMAILGALLRRTTIVLAVLFTFYALDGLMGFKLPGAFVPNEDQGVVFVQINLPYGSSLDRNRMLTDRIRTDLATVPGVQSIATMGGFTLLSAFASPDISSFVITLKPWSERTAKELGLRSIVANLYKRLQAYPEAAAFPFIPPTIPGLGQSSGFNFELQDLTGHSVIELSNVAEKVQAAALQRPEIGTMNNTMRVYVPQIHLDVNREKAKSLGVNVSDIFANLGAMLGSAAVNQFTLFNRTWNVMIQADEDYRVNEKSINGIYVRSSANQMVPLSTLVKSSRIYGPDMLQHFNANREIEFFGASSAGFSSGQAIAAMQQVAKTAIPPGFGYSWAGTAYQQVAVGNTQALVFALSLLLVFLLLAAQYESWLMPLAVLMGVPIGVFGAFASVLLWRLDLNVYVQIGLIMLIGLAAKNAILIVEFARERHERDGVPIFEAAREGAQLRFRPILMTSFAFIIGVLPLMLAGGAGAASRHSLGSAVFGGMLAATCLGVFFIPTLFAVFASLRERGRRRPAALAQSSPPHAGHGSGTA